MRLRIPSLLIAVLALLLVNAGMARTQLLLCQNQCVQARGIEIPPCCAGGQEGRHAAAQQLPGGAGECPHVADGKRVADFAFPYSAPTISVPVAPLAGGSIPADLIPPAALAASAAILAGASPPGPPSSPLYHLYCSLLI